MDDNAFVNQPESDSSIQVKPMERADAEFAGSMQINAFESKFVHAVGKQKWVQRFEIKCYQF